ncbi:MAG: hypothetical protein C0459_11270 [Chitinophaga sp.]|jgi:hypothetical protein|nr:hypothetical protein [Chitinophaga sp.]
MSGINQSRVLKILPDDNVFVALEDQSCSIPVRCEKQEYIAGENIGPRGDIITKAVQLVQDDFIP